jgi:hypothetical protein
MNDSLNTGQIASALAKAQAQCQAAEKTGKNHNKGTYAKLEDLQAKSQPAFGDNDLSLIMSPYSSTPGMFGLTWRLTHISGEFMGDKFEVPVNAKSPQDYGSCMTYFRRYVLAGLLPLVGDEDPDEVSPAQDNATASKPKAKALPKASAKSKQQTSDHVTAAVQATRKPETVDDFDEDF